MRDEVIERAAAEGVRLIISVDTGIRAFAAADTARRTGIDLIVTDHHLPGADGVPQALAVVNPIRGLRISMQVSVRRRSSVQTGAGLDAKAIRDERPVAPFNVVHESGGDCDDCGCGAVVGQIAY